MIRGEDILFLSGIGWDFSWQRHQQIASHFARNNRVFFVEMALSPASLLAEGKATLARWADWARGVRKVGDGLFVYPSPPVLPFGRSSLAINRVNQALIARGVKRAMRELGMEEPLAWVSEPYLSSLSRDFGQKLTVFDWIHGVAGGGHGRRRAVYLALLGELLQRADVIITPSRGVYERHGAKDSRFFFVPNGVDIQLYAAVSASGAPPPELASLRGPLIGFSGTVGPAVDLGLVESMARERKEWSFVFVGLVRRSVGALRDFPNVHFLGPKSREELPLYLSRFSAGIIPYVLSEETETVHPVKTYEYLAAGLPVVSTALRELEPLRGTIELVRDSEDFLQRLERAVEDDSESRREERRRLAREEHSWEERMVAIEEAIGAVRAKP